MPRYLIIIGCLVISLGIGIGFLLPNYREIKKLMQIEKEHKQELDYQKKYLADLNNANQALGKYQDPMAKVDSSLPKDMDLPSLYHHIQDLASKNGLLLKQVSPPAISSADELQQGKEISLLFPLSGSYESLKTFLTSISQSSRWLRVESVGFSSPDKGTVFDFAIGLAVYSY